MQTYMKTARCKHCSVCAHACWRLYDLMLVGKIHRFGTVFQPNIRSLGAKKETGEEEEGWYLMKRKVRFKGLGWPHLPVWTRVELSHDSYRLLERKQSPIRGWEADNRRREEDVWHYTQIVNVCKSSNFRQTHRCISRQHVWIPGRDV